MLALPMTAFASNAAASSNVVNAAAIDYTQNTVTFTGTVDTAYAGRIATLVVVNPGKNFTDLINDPASTGVLNWADQTKVAADGTFAFAPVVMTYSTT